MKIEEKCYYSKNFYNEFLNVLSNYKSIIRRPFKKIKGAKFDAFKYGIISLIILIIFIILNITFKSNTYLLVMIFYIFLTSMSLIYFIIVNSRLGKLAEIKNDVTYTFNKDYIKCIFPDAEYEIKWESIKYILINKYTICFIPNSTENPLIALDIKYLDKINEITKKYKKENIVVDNTNLYKKRGE